MPADYSLHDLHDVIQIAMGWEDDHLHEFTIHRQGYAPADFELTNTLEESRVKLRDVVKAGDKFSYNYDFGDDWNHLIAVEKVIDGDPAAPPMCVAGARACPPEDSGGPFGYRSSSTPSMRRCEALSQVRKKGRRR